MATGNNTVRILSMKYDYLGGNYEFAYDSAFAGFTITVNGTS
jgi:hypothetical protein